jgi:hypothetical protein
MAGTKAKGRSSLQEGETTPAFLQIFLVVAIARINRKTKSANADS